jgi:hypothetical protein
MRRFLWLLALGLCHGHRQSVFLVQQVKDTADTSRLQIVEEEGGLYSFDWNGDKLHVTDRVEFEEDFRQAFADVKVLLYFLPSISVHTVYLFVCIVYILVCTVYLFVSVYLFVCIVDIFVCTVYLFVSVYLFVCIVYLLSTASTYIELTI